MSRHRKKSQNVHTKSCLHDEPGVTICCCWLDLERHQPGASPMSMADPVFESLPSGLDIAHWFNARTFQNQGGDAFLLCVEPPCWLWHLATIDHDDQEFYLLVIGTSGTQDMLLVTKGMNEACGCEWRNRPSEKQDWGAEAICWFANRVEAIEEGWNRGKPLGTG